MAGVRSGRLEGGGVGDVGGSCVEGSCGGSGGCSGEGGGGDCDDDGGCCSGDGGVVVVMGVVLLIVVVVFMEAVKVVNFDVSERVRAVFKKPGEAGDWLPTLGHATPRGQRSRQPQPTPFIVLLIRATSLAP